MCVCVRTCMCVMYVYMYVGANACTHLAEARGGCHVSCSTFLILLILSLTLDLGWCPASPVLGL